MNVDADSQTVTGSGADGIPLALRFYRTLLGLYPRDFREAYGADMCAAFRDRYEDRLTGEQEGGGARIRTALVMLCSAGSDTVRNAISERLNSSLRPPDGGPIKGRASRPSRGRWLTWFGEDLRQALRRALRQPGFTLVVALTLALGIGANTALFSVLHGVLLSPLPYPEPDQIVLLFEREVDLGWERNAFPPGNIRAYQQQNTTFETIGAYFNTSATLTGDGDPERVAVQGVTSEVLAALRVRPHLGRLLQPGDEVPGHDRVVVLSYRFWQNRFGADPDAVGRSLIVDGQAHTVVGILPEDFRFPNGAPELWLPLALGEAGWAERRNHFLSGIGRLRSGVGIDDGLADLTAIAHRREEEYPNTNPGSLVNVFGLRDVMVGDVEQPLWLMMAAAAFVLLIACANVANLFLARGLAREREFAVRGALGAGRRRLLHLLTTESLLLAVIGGAAGIFLAWLGLETVRVLNPGNLPRIETIGINGPVLLFCALVTLLTSLLFGIAPAFLIARSKLVNSLRAGSARLTQSTASRRAKNILAVIQIAAAVVLLAGAGLLIRSFVRLQRVDPGFTSESVLQATISLAGERYRTTTAVHNFQQELTNGLVRAPAIEQAGEVSNPPMSMAPQIFLRIEGREPEGDQPPVVSRIYASSRYFAVLDLTLLEGRLFDDLDHIEAPGVVVITQSMAERHWPDESPLGRTVRIGPRETPPLEVIGVVSDLRQYGLRYGAFPTAFLSLSQVRISSFTVMMKVSVDPSAALTHLRATVRDLDPNLPLTGVSTLDDVLSANVARPRFTMFLAAAFAAVALVLAVVGIYSVLAYAVSQRTHELGIRLALGAERARIISLVLRQGLALTGLSLALGLPLAWLFTRTMESLLYQITTTDPVTFVGLALVIAVSALAACLIPAVRAAGVNPLGAMRQE